MFAWYRRQGLFAKAALPIAVLIALSTVAMAIYVSRSEQMNAMSQARLSAQASIEQFKILRRYYTENVVGKVSGQTGLRVSFDHAGRGDTIPLPATMIHELSEEFSRGQSGVKMRLYSDLPFPNRKDRVLDDFERDAIAALKARPDEVYSRFFDEKGMERLRVAVADKMVASSCVSCHNSHPQSPFHQWKIGDVRGVLEIEAPLAQQMASTREAIAGITLFIAAVSLLLIGFIFVLFRKFVFAPVQSVAAALRQTAEMSLEKSKGIRESSADVSQGTMNQAAAIQESAASLEQIEAMVTHSLESAVRTAELSKTSQDDVQKGREAVAQMVGAINNIKEGNQAVNTQIAAFRDRSNEITRVINEIANKTNVINDIVFQTKLLSFNASVEAARAGEAGRGFSVVAEEVGSLAAMSGLAAKEITEMVASSIATVQAMVSEMQANVDGTMLANQQKVDAGIEVAARCEQTLEKVVQSAQEIHQSMTSLKIATEEQGYGITTVRTAMTSLDEKNTHNNRAAELAAEHAQEIHRQAGRLGEMVDELELVLGGHGGKAGDRPEASAGSDETKAPPRAA